MKQKLKTAAEYDVIAGHGKWRKYLCYLQRAGTTSGIKRQVRRRARHEAKLDIKNERD